MVSAYFLSVILNSIFGTHQLLPLLVALAGHRVYAINNTSSHLVNVLAKPHNRTKPATALKMAVPNLHSQRESILVFLRASVFNHSPATQNPHLRRLEKGRMRRTSDERSDQ